MPPPNRSRTPREDSPHRKPFSAAPSPRAKYSFPVVNTPVLRRSRHNSENQPPEVAFNVKANSPFSDANVSPSPFPKATSSKAKHHGSQSLPPRPPPPRPSPLANPVKSNHDAQGNVKRKLNLEPAACAEASKTSHELDNGVKVIIRLRPRNQKEESEDVTPIVEKVSSDSLWLADQSFTFDHVAGQDASQQSMFNLVGRPLVENCLQGFNSSIFAYGQTGSGKTYTMWGATQGLLAQPLSEDRGLTPRVFECLFHRIKEEESKNAEKQLRYQCRCSFLEIYNEQITDLLEPLQKSLQVREDTKMGVYVENLTEEFVSSVQDVFRIMLKGLGNRKVASTSMNLESSRSHTVFTCVIESRCKSMSDGVSSVRTSRMNLVDLAGSERQKLTGAAGERLKEAGNINRSLSQLGNLINILAEVSQTGKQRHIPYRDSRLTFLLQESLGGNAKLAMICAISPASSCKIETLSTLRFAQRAKSIQNKAVVNEETEDDVKVLREQIRQLKDELMRMKSNETVPGAAGGYSTSWNARRSYNLLRMSLSRPLTLPHTTESDTDEEMEIDEDAVESAEELVHAESIKGWSSSDEGLQHDNMDHTKKHLKSPSSKNVVVSLVPDGGSKSDAEGQMETHFADPKCEPQPSMPAAKESLGLESSIQGQMAAQAEIAKADATCKDQDTAIVGAQSTEMFAPMSPISSPVQDNLCSVEQSPPTTIINLSGCGQGLLPLTSGEVIYSQASPQASTLRCSATVDFESSITLDMECKDCENGDVQHYESVCPSQGPGETSAPMGQEVIKDSCPNVLNEFGMPALGEPLQDLKGNETICIQTECKSLERPVADSMDAATRPNPCVEDTCRVSFQTDSSAEFMDSYADDVLLQSLQSPPVSSGGILPNLDDSVTTKRSIASDGTQLQQPARTEDGMDSLVKASDEQHELSPNKAHGDDTNESVVTGADSSDTEAPEREPVLRYKAHGDDTNESVVNGADSSDTEAPEQEPVLRSPVLSISPHLAMAALEAPVLSVSPKLFSDRSRSFGMGSFPALVEDTSLKPYSTLAESKDTNTSTSYLKSSMQSSQKLSSPTNRLAASLHRGLQIIENHQKMKVTNTRMSTVLFSFQTPEWEKPKATNTVTKSVQTSLVSFLGKTPDQGDVLQINRSLRVEQGSLDEPSTPQRVPNSPLGQNMQAVLAGALRRERLLEDELNCKSAEIEQLNLLVRQYKHERECNAVLQQSLEDKIARLEGLMDGTLPTDSFLNEEWSTLINEHKILKRKYDHHPEVTLANIKQQHLREEIEKYKRFCDLGEKDTLLCEVSHLRNQVQYYVDMDTPNPSRHRQRSLTPEVKPSAADEQGFGKSMVFEQFDHMNSNTISDMEPEGCKRCEKEAVEWAEREREWMSVLEELRMDVEEYKQLSEKRKHEIGGQQRCAEEMKEALQMAMEGHARLLDQYAEFQEKHIGLLAKHRKIRDAMANARKKAGKLGFLGAGKWFEAHAAELIAVKLEQEQERKAAKEQIEGLQAQLRDTADAVQAAGELLVRLKEAEEATLIAQDAAALAEQDADRLYREIDKLKRRHSTEIATLQQRLLEARFQKSTLCPMCVMAERVKFEFTGVDDQEAAAALEAQHLAAEAANDHHGLATSGHIPLEDFQGEGDYGPSYDDKEELYVQGLNDGLHGVQMDDRRWYEEDERCNI